ncbi:LysR family transcriptional regulator, partial [Streptomyces asiaticus]
PIPALPPLPVGWAARRWDALPPLARAFADTVARTLRGDDASSEGNPVARRE